MFVCVTVDFSPRSEGEPGTWTCAQAPGEGVPGGWPNGQDVVHLFRPEIKHLGDSSFLLHQNY